MNIADIAKLAGVSSAAVSRYFNQGYISDEKRAAIRKVVEETGYQPSAQAQTLRTKKTKMIGVIAPKMASASIGRVVEGMLSVLNDSEYQMILAVTQNDPKKELEYLNAFRNKQVDGVILIGTVFLAEHKRVLKNMAVPVVIIGQKLAGYCCVYHDDYHATYELTRLMMEKGRKNLAYLSAIHQDKAAGLERYKGYRDAVRSVSDARGADDYVISHFTVQSGYEKGKELMEKYPDVDGIVCATDEMAVGAMKYLKEQNYSIPERILIAGQGDSVMADIVSPPLLTVHYSYEKSGEMAIRMLLEILEKGDTEVKEIKLGFSIVEQ